MFIWIQIQTNLEFKDKLRSDLKYYYNFVSKSKNFTTFLYLNLQNEDHKVVFSNNQRKSIW